MDVKRRPLIWAFRRFTACDTNCKMCTANGVGKCDPGQCKDDFFYSDVDKLCSKYPGVIGVLLLLACV